MAPQGKHKATGGGDPAHERELDAVYDQCRQMEQKCRQEATRRMIVYGLLYKEGHIHKNWTMRLFVLDGGKLSYYKLGESSAKGFFFVHRINKVAAFDIADRKHSFRVATKNKSYMLQAPDEQSMTIWVDALRPVREGWLVKQGSKVKNWKRRYFVQYRTELAYFDKLGGNFKGNIFLKHVLPGSLEPLDNSVFGKDNVFKLEITDRTFYMQAVSEQDRQVWLHALAQAVQVRGAVDDSALQEDAGGAAMSPSAGRSDLPGTGSRPVEQAAGAEDEDGDGLSEDEDEKDGGGGGGIELSDDLAAAMAALSSQQSPAAAAAAVAVAAPVAAETGDSYTLILENDGELFKERRKWTGCVESYDGLCGAISSELALGCDISVLVYDADFEEWVLLTELDELPRKANVQVKKR